jgi:hypothetical protein
MCKAVAAVTTAAAYAILNLSLLAALKFFCCNAEKCVLNATAENS